MIMMLSDKIGGSLGDCVGVTGMFEESETALVATLVAILGHVVSTIRIVRER